MSGTSNLNLNSRLMKLIRKLTICELSLISVKSFCQDIVGVFPFFFKFSFILATKSACFFLAAVDNPVVKIPTSILPDNGSVADCFNASRCNLFEGYCYLRNVVNMPKLTGKLPQHLVLQQQCSVAL